MPNWVRNRLVAMGTEEQIHDFIKNTTTCTNGHSRVLDFGKIVPIPPIYVRDLCGRESDIICICASDIMSNKELAGANADALLQYAAKYRRCYVDDLLLSGDEYNKTLTRILKTKDFDGNVLAKNAYDVRILGTQLLVAYHMYNTYDSLDWCCKYWGTKWNAVDNDMSLSYCNHGDNLMTASMTFDTAWSEPTEIYQRIIQDYPDMRFEIVYANEDIGIGVGVIKYDGKEARYVEYDNDSQLAMVNAISLWNLWDDYEFDKHTKQWIYVGEE